MCVFCCTDYNGEEMEKKTLTFENSVELVQRTIKTGCSSHSSGFQRPP